MYKNWDHCTCLASCRSCTTFFNEIADLTYSPGIFLPNHLSNVNRSMVIYFQCVTQSFYINNSKYCRLLSKFIAKKRSHGRSKFTTFCMLMVGKLIHSYLEKTVLNNTVLFMCYIYDGLGFYQLEEVLLLCMESYNYCWILQVSTVNIKCLSVQCLELP